MLVTATIPAGIGTMRSSSVNLSVAFGPPEPVFYGLTGPTAIQQVADSLLISTPAHAMAFEIFTFTIIFILVYLTFSYSFRS